MEPRHPWTAPDGILAQEKSFFDDAYDGVPPWDIGRPQPEIVRLEGEGLIQREVLDVGCGTGENALFLAQRGHRVLGIDRATKAITRAKQKATARGLVAEFLVWDALKLPGLSRGFDTVIDAGLFHVFADEERGTFVDCLGEVLKLGGRYLMLCFSDKEPGNWGPRRIKKAEIQRAFGGGWTVDSILPSRFATHLDDSGAHSWTVTISRPGKQ